MELPGRETGLPDFARLVPQYDFFGEEGNASDVLLNIESIIKTSKKKAAEQAAAKKACTPPNVLLSIKRVDKMMNLATRGLPLSLTSPYLKYNELLIDDVDLSQATLRKCVKQFGEGMLHIISSHEPCTLDCDYGSTMPLSKVTSLAQTCLRASRMTKGSPFKEWNVQDWVFKIQMKSTIACVIRASDGSPLGVGLFIMRVNPSTGFPFCIIEALLNVSVANKRALGLNASAYTDIRGVGNCLVELAMSLVRFASSVPVYLPCGACGLLFAECVETGSGALFWKNSALCAIPESLCIYLQLYILGVNLSSCCAPMAALIYR